MTKITTQAECVFCKRSFSKNSMSRHLVSCQARQAASQALAGQPGLHPAQLFHLRIEGRDNPEYWMDVEIPADAMLADLDDFLRDTWLECCGHLSAFEIEGREYLAEPEGGMMGIDLLPSPFMPGDMTEDEPVPDDAKESALQLARIIGASEKAQAAFRVEFDQIVEQHDPGQPLTDEQAKLLVASMGRMIGMDQAMVDQVLDSIQGRSESDEDEFSDEGTMDVALSAVLKPGLTFHHEYDFGSSTRLTLRVVEKRAGYAPEIEPDFEEDTGDEDYEEIVRVLAQNEPPKIMCAACRKNLATQVCTYCYGLKGWLCDDCAGKHEHAEDAFLPVVNSPRVGVCGYDGGLGYLEIESGDEDFEDEDEEDEETL